MQIQRMLRSILTISFFTFFTFWAQAQKLDYVQGQFIVQIDTEETIENVLRTFEAEHGYEVELHKRVTPVFNIYTVNYDFTKLRDETVWRDLLMHPNVEIAQHNHFTELRQNIPNDPEFPNQWQYVNMGQDGGVVGADIDMPEAWVNATGGLTAEGDTIVACIIDDGIDNTHPDITPNLFINHAEIPGNGIDDDNNGFIDDVRGWRTGTDNDNVYTGGGHGTPVTGIVGAKGNDEFGVAGVNWDVKLMIVRGGTNVETEVLEAYSYPYSFRKRYNETDGEEGAFVVTTNASWGLDFGQPENAPLWCAFYDSLGQQGILNCGATINGNQNVDVVGDLPTACPSDYLISVTNMNRTDVKVTGAGYGLETIDLGAFGQQTWTVTAGGGFGGFGGTSGATPHVTGTIALMYSLPCSNLITLAKSDPAAAALLIKEAILDGTDPNASLEGITVSGGRLNVNNTMNILLGQYCGDCVAPFEIATDIGLDSITFSWNAADTTSTNFRFRILGDPDWTTFEDVGNSVTINDLLACTEYEYQLQSVCPDTIGDWSINRIITTTGCCENPESFTGEITDDSGASLEWTAAEFANSYNLRYRETGAMDWIDINTTEISFVIEDLMNCTEYEFQIQTVCDTESEDFSESLVLFIPNCDNPCVDFPFCEIMGYNATEEFIGTVEVSDLVNVSGNDDGYGDFTMDFSPTLMAGGSYNMTLEPIYVGNTFPESFAVWLDINHNGMLEDEEKLLELDDITELVTEVINIPENANLGSTRMRVAMRFQTQPPNCTPDNFNAFGETEDYCFNVVEFVCTGISIQDTTFTGFTEIGLSFTENLNVDTRLVSYKKLTDTDWIEEEINDLEQTISNLEECSEYEFRTRTQCGADFTEYTESVVYSTQCVNSIEGLDDSFISIYPNPFNDIVTIELGLKDYTNMSYEVYNQVGAIVQKANLGNAKKHQVAFGAISSGVYYIRIMENSKTITYKKVVKM